MNPQYIVAPLAQQDIRAAYDYIARRSTKNATKVVGRIYDQFDRIARTPGMGHTRPELHNDLLRVMSVFRFLIIYDGSRRPVEIIRVIHGAMDLEDEFGG